MNTLRCLASISFFK